MCEDVAMKNEFIRHGGFSPQQWVLGKAPKSFGDLGVLESQVGGAAQFGRRSDMRFAARKAFVHEDCSRRSRAAVLRKAAPIHTSYQVGDIVVYTDSIAEQEKDPTWSSAARIIGFEDKTAWLIHQGIPIAAALSPLTPRTTAELLAHQVLTRGQLNMTLWKVKEANSKDSLISEENMTKCSAGQKHLDREQPHLPHLRHQSREEDKDPEAEEDHRLKIEEYPT